MKLRKHGKSERSKTIKKLDTLWSTTVRGRDKICRKCKKAPASQAAHIFSRSHFATRWLLSNGLGLCYYCHIIWAHRNPIEFTLWVSAEVGKRKLKTLERQANDKRFQFHPRDAEKIKEEILNG